MPATKESPGLSGVPTAATGPPRPVAAFSPSSPIGAPPASPPGAAATSRATTGESSGKVTTGNPPGNTGEGSPAGTFAYVRDAVQRKIVYPATARRMGWEGKVVVAFRLLPDGSVRDVRVIRGSGHATLDRGAVAAVRIASPFPRPPAEAEIVTPVVYRLTPAP